MSVNTFVQTCASDIERVLKACEIRGVLRKHLADHAKCITYRGTAKPIGIFSAGLAPYLGMIQDDDHANGRPLLSALVVSKQTEMPSSGFFTHARSLGYNIPETPEGELGFWKGQLKLLGANPVVAV